MDRGAPRAQALQESLARSPVSGAEVVPVRPGTLSGTHALRQAVSQQRVPPVCIDGVVRHARKVRGPGNRPVG